MKKPTEKQIELEIKKLRTMKPTVLRQSMFGDDHHAAIDVQIQVLENRMTEDKVCDTFPSDVDGVERSNRLTYASNIYEAAVEAALWMNGESQYGVPSKGWKELVKK